MFCCSLECICYVCYALAAILLYEFIAFFFLHFVMAPRNKVVEQFKGDTALVTGATDGIGKEFSKLLYAKGLNVILLGRNQTKLDQLKREMEGNAPSASAPFVTTLALDCSSLDFDVWNAAQAKLKALEEEKKTRISVLINNVGGQGREVKDGPDAFHNFEDLTLRDHFNCIAVNLYPFMTFTHGILKNIKYKYKKGIVINVSSAVSTTGFPFVSTYSGAKSFMNSWSQSVNHEMMADLNDGGGSIMDKLRELFVSNPFHDVLIETHICGEVRSATIKTDKNWMCPDANEWANASLQFVGCSRKLPWMTRFSPPYVCIPFFSHAVANLALAHLIPEVLSSAILWISMWQRVKVFKGLDKAKTE